MYKIFVINLEKDLKRKSYIENHLKEKNLEFEIITGVYGKEISSEKLMKTVDFITSAKKMGKPISLNEVGCSLSHQKVYKKIIQENLEGAFVFEDDVILSKDIKKIIASIHDNKDKLPNNIWLGLGRSYVDCNKPLFKVNENFSIYKSARTWGTIAYYIDKQAAKKLIKLNTPVIFVSDWFFGGYVNTLNLYAIDKVCAIANPKIHSVIAETRIKEKNFIKNIFYSIRKFYTRIYYYRYIFSVLSGRLRKAKLSKEFSQ